MNETESKSKSKKQRKIKKLISAGYISCIMFSIFLSVFFLFDPGFCDKATVCGVIERATFLKIILLFVFMVFLIIIFLLILKCVKEKDLNKEAGVGKNLAKMLLILTLGILFSVMIFTSISSPQCRVNIAKNKSLLSTIKINQEIYFDDNNEYFDSFEELIDYGLIDKNSLENFKEAGIEIKRSDNSKSWYADVKLYTTERRFPCADKKIENVYFCNQDGCNF